MTTLKLATYPLHAGKTSVVNGVTVERVFHDDPAADIAYFKFKADYSAYSARPFVLVKSRRQFATLKAAVAARLKETP